MNSDTEESEATVSMTQAVVIPRYLNPYLTLPEEDAVMPVRR